MCGCGKTRRIACRKPSSWLLHNHRHKRFVKGESLVVLHVYVEAAPRFHEKMSLYQPSPRRILFRMGFGTVGESSVSIIKTVERRCGMTLRAYNERWCGPIWANLGQPTKTCLEDVGRE